MSAPAKSRGSEKRWHAHLYGFRAFDNAGVGPATFEEEDAGADLVVMSSGVSPTTGTERRYEATYGEWLHTIHAE